MNETLTRYARGTYQQDLLTGRARWSGSDLRGTAKKFGGRYARSRRALLARLRAAGINAESALIRSASGRTMRVLLVDGVPVSATR